MSTLKSKILYAIALVVLSASVQGCDFVRTLAGRPTSSDLAAASEKMSIIERRKAALVRAQAIMKADSVAMVRDSLLADSVAASGIIDIRRMSSLRYPPVHKNDFRYCLMMGYFNTGANATRLADKIRQDGLEPNLMLFEDGSTAVGLFPSRWLSDVMSGIDSVRTKRYFPEDFWVVYNDLN